MTQYMKRPIIEMNVMRGNSIREGMVPMADAATLRHATATAMRRIISSVSRKQMTVKAHMTYVIYLMATW